MSDYRKDQQSPVPIDRISPELRKCIYRTAGDVSIQQEMPIIASTPNRTAMRQGFMAQQWVEPGLSQK
jgi:hypothetical protein